MSRLDDELCRSTSEFNDTFLSESLRWPYSRAICLFPYMRAGLLTPLTAHWIYFSTTKKNPINIKAHIVQLCSCYTHDDSYAGTGIWQKEPTFLSTNIYSWALSSYKHLTARTTDGTYFFLIWLVRLDWYFLWNINVLLKKSVLSFFLTEKTCSMCIIVCTV